MATKPVQPEIPLPAPSMEEIADVLERHGRAKFKYEQAHLEYFATRKEVVSVLKRAGVDGFSL